MKPYINKSFGKQWLIIQSAGLKHNNNTTNNKLFGEGEKVKNVKIEELSAAYISSVKNPFHLYSLHPNKLKMTHNTVSNYQGIK